MCHIGLCFGPAAIFLLGEGKPVQSLNRGSLGLGASAQLADYLSALSVAEWVFA